MDELVLIKRSNGYTVCLRESIGDRVPIASVLVPHGRVNMIQYPGGMFYVKDDEGRDPTDDRIARYMFKSIMMSILGVSLSAH